MAARSKGTTRSTTFRYDDDEDTTIDKVVSAYADAGITMSRNDAIRALVRFGFDPVPADLPGVQRAMTRHQAKCTHCGAPKGPRCPFWMRLIALQQRFQRTAQEPDPDTYTTALLRAAGK